jgi:hypothetical protein
MIATHIAIVDEQQPVVVSFFFLSVIDTRHMRTLICNEGEQEDCTVSNITLGFSMRGPQCMVNLSKNGTPWCGAMREPAPVCSTCNGICATRLSDFDEPHSLGKPRIQMKRKKQRSRIINHCGQHVITRGGNVLLAS